MSHVVAAAMTYDGLIVLKDDGTVWTLAPRGRGVSAARVPGLNHITSIAAGADHFLALESDGTVFAWGKNTDGQLGDGTTTDHHSPEQVDKLSNVVAIAAGLDHSLAVERDGSVWAWGDNSFIDLGTWVGGMCPDGPCSQVPIRVPGVHGAVAVAAGNDRSLALASDGTVWQWGWDDLADDVRGVYRVARLSHITAVSAGDFHTLALGQDGTVWAWGSGQLGELGDGAIADSPTPVHLEGLGHIRAIAAGHWLSVALTTNGLVSTWGIDAGQYIDPIDPNASNGSSHPVTVQGPTGIEAVTAGETGIVMIGTTTPRVLSPTATPTTTPTALPTATPTMPPTATPTMPPTATPAPITLSGAGASAVDPLLSGSWARGSAAAIASPAISVTYTSTLTSTDEAAGLTPWLTGKADFTATDLPLTGSQERAAMQRCGGSVMTAPVAVGGVALTYHLPGVGARLVLPPAVLAPLLLGQIHDWNDVRLQRANPDLALPQLPIRLIYRSDAAADTDTLTRYLTSISPEWKARVGAGLQVRWPTGQGENGSLGVLAQVLRTPGALGYVALQDALAQYAPLAALRDHAGQDVTPSLVSVERAASSLATSLPRDLQQRLIDAPGAGAYPLAGYSFLDFCGTHQGAKPGAKAIALRELARYIVTTGQAALPAQHLAPLPATVQRAALAILPAAP